MTKTLTFPPGFVWGAATAAYQVEGAVDADGRRPSIWDTFSHRPGKVANGDTGDVACDHYNRLHADLDLMAELGLASYRFSVSWSRVVGDDDGRVNEQGLDFYRRLVDGLLERDIKPMMTLYHWDLPQWREDRGGWLDRETAEHFADVALLLGKTLGDRVESISTLNEPWCSAFLGYGTGGHAPGRSDNGSAFTAAHHLNLAHGRAVSALRSVLPSSATLSVALNLMQVEPASDSEEDRDAAEHVDLVANQVFLEPMLRGRYPGRLIAETAEVTDWDFVMDGDLEIIAQPIDELGVNYYAPTRVSAVGGRFLPADRGSLHGPGATNIWPGTRRAQEDPAPGPRTNMGWPVVPAGLTRLLTYVGSRYPGTPLYVTENGAAYDDVPTADGKVHDPDRISYVRDHLAAVHDAVTQGVDVRGYYLWSFMDNFEWAWGFAKRFGVVYVDFDSLKRTPKDSAHWYRDVIADNAVLVAE
jgi:beta-glucosidase